MLSAEKCLDVWIFFMQLGKSKLTENLFNVILNESIKNAQKEHG